MNLNLITTDKYVNCPDLDAAELFLIWDFDWARENEEAIRNTKGVQSFNIGLGLFYIHDANDRLLFALRWP